MPKYKYTLVKDPIDDRDWIFSSQLVSKPDLPKKFDLRDKGFVPPILNQQSLGSCAPTQISNALRYCLRRDKITDFQPSRLFIYYFARVIDKLPIDQDTGITIRGGLKAVSKYAACSEIWWPYIIRNFKIKPPDACIQAAAQHLNGFAYYSIPRNLTQIKQAIYNGLPVILGIQIYDSLEADETLQTGVIPIPNIQTEKSYGAHCVALYSYDDTTRTFGMMNSWGTAVGQQGWFQLSYDFVMNPDLATDFWTIVSFK